jgi:hypothetical protein
MSNYPTVIDFAGPVYVTRKTEGILRGANHVMNKEIYTLYGEYSGKDPKELISKVTKTKDTNCSFTSLSLDESQGIGGIWPYRAECECYYFMSGEGIVDFKKEVSAVENMDGTISASRNIMVQAICTPTVSDPISAALSLVQVFSGEAAQINIGTKSISDLNQVVKVSEILNIDRVNGTCNLQQNYIANSSLIDINKRGIIKQSTDFQSGVDGIATQTKRTTVIGGTGMPDSSLIGVGNTVSVDPLKLISKNVIVDSGRNTIDITDIYSNDGTFDSTAGCKCANSLNFNYDFIGRTYSAVYNVESSPASAMISGSALTPCLENINTSDIASLDPCALTYDLIETITGGAALKLIKTENYINSPSLLKIGSNGSGYNASIQINYEPGYHYNTASPILSGQGTWYIEDLGLNTNATVGGTVSLNYGDAVPTVSDLYAIMKTGFPFTPTTKAQVIKDEFSIDPGNKKATYTYLAICNDTVYTKIGGE